MKRTRWAKRCVVWASTLGIGLLAASALADGPILHERIPPDPGEDASLAATTPNGALPAALETPSGIATAPPLEPRSSARVYGSASTGDAPDSSYQPDRDTRRPNVEMYDDPFSPSTTPFKRLRAYDAVADDYSLVVRDRSLRPMSVGGAMRVGDEAFYADMTVDLLGAEPVRIPTVGPGARVLKLSTTPTTPIELFHDGADNWFVKSTSRSRVRLIMQIAIARDSLGGAFADVSWPVLSAFTVPSTAAHQAASAEVEAAIGVSRAMRPRAVVERLVGYFRSFEPSDEPPRGRDDIYLDLSLSQKGVCRHRAFAFLVTALDLGIPARMIVNEAHAWVEVFDGSLWHRIDLGGAAANLQSNDDPTRPPHVPPPDPYAWPVSHDSGQDLAQRSRSEPGDATSSAPPDPSSTTTDPAVPAPVSSSEPSATPEPPPAPLGASSIQVKPLAGEVRRGAPVRLRGRITSAAGSCAHVRVDVRVRGGAYPDGASLGSLSTDERGEFDGEVVVPRDFQLGDYRLYLSTPGDGTCGPSKP